MHRIKKRLFIYQGEVTVEVYYYNSGVIHVRFPTFKTGCYRNSFADTSKITLYFDGEPQTFYERYLRSAFFDHIDINNRNEYNEIILKNTRLFRFFWVNLKNMVLAGELVPVEE